MGHFIISFDCEGKWGKADSITNYHQQVFTNKNLVNIYQRIIHLLNKYEIPATFAFVGAFTLSLDQYHAMGDVFRAPILNGVPWLINFNREMALNNYDGWLAPECFRLVQQQGAHEIASHGFTHVPLDEHSISQEDFLYEMYLIREYFYQKNKSNMTLVYPKNQVGFTQFLSQSGFIGYRDNKHSHNQPKYGLIRRYFRDNIIMDKSEISTERALPVAIPSGYFLTWRRGWHALIPKFITSLKWKMMINEIMNSDKVLHLWTHPHNFLTGVGMLNMLESILKEVSVATKYGDITPITQQDYCRKLVQNSHMAGNYYAT